LLYQAYSPALAHELWLYSSLKSIDVYKEHLDILIKRQLTKINIPEDRWWVGEKDTAGPQDDIRLLCAKSLYYMVEHFLDHAASFESLTGQSSFLIFESFGIVRLAYYHALLHRAHYSCCWRSGESRFYKVYTMIHLAVCHSLNLYIKSYLEQEEEPISASPTRSGTPTMLKETNLVFPSTTMPRASPDMIKEWAMESIAYSDMDYNKVADYRYKRPAIQTLRVVLELFPTLTTGEVATTIASRPVNACLEVITTYWAHQSKVNEEDISQYLQDKKYDKFLYHLGFPSSLFLWSLGKRVWHATKNQHYGIHNCVVDDLYTTIIQQSGFESETAAQLVLFGFLDGRLRGSGRPERPCRHCYIVNVGFCLGMITSFDLIGPYGCLRESALYCTLQENYPDSFEIYLDFCEMIFDTDTTRRRMETKSEEKLSRSRIQTYVSVLRATTAALYRTPDDYDRALYVDLYAVVQPYFQTLPSMAWQESTRIHVRSAFGQARTELLNGERYVVGEWSGRLGAIRFNKLIEYLRERRILTTEEEENLCIHDSRVGR